MFKTFLTQNWVGDSQSDCTDNKLNKVHQGDESLSSVEITTQESSEAISIYDFPCEILLKIFSYLDEYSLINGVALVCKLWNNLAKDKSLWKSLVLDEKRAPYIPNLTVQFPNLQHLKVEGGNLNEETFNSLADLTELQTLSLKFCDISQESSVSFETVLKNCKNLYVLELEGCEVCCNVLEKLREGKGLKKINLSHCIHLGNKSLIQILENCPNINELDLDGINFLRDYAISSIFSTCSSNLESLIIDGEDLSDSAFVKLNCCSELKRFGVSFCDTITDRTLSKIKQLKHLEYLKLRKGNNLTPLGVERMFREGSLNKITHLNLSECSLINNTSVLAIADCCRDLLSLDLAWCWEVTDESLVYLVNKCQRIIILDLTGLVCLHGQFILNLKEGSLKYIKVIDLEQCGFIKDDQLLELVQLRPNIKIFNFWGDIINSMNVT